MNRKILILGLSLILLILPISTSTPVWAQQMYPPPMVAGITPSSGEQGQTLDLIISGHYFQDGASISFAPPVGITINSLTLVSAMELGANINIDPDAPLLPRDVTVTNPDAQYATVEGGFTVRAKGCTDLYLAYVEAQQAASKACLTYDLLKLDAKSKINDAEKTVNDKDKALQACLDETNKELEELAQEKAKLEKEIAELNSHITELGAEIVNLDNQAKVWKALTQKASVELDSVWEHAKGIAGLEIGTKVLLAACDVATGPVGLTVTLIIGAWEIGNATKARLDFNYYTEQYNNTIKKIIEVDTQITQLNKQLASKQAELARLESEMDLKLETACATQKGELAKAKAALEVLKADFEEKLKKAKEECDKATKQKEEAEAAYDNCLKSL